METKLRKLRILLILIVLITLIAASSGLVLAEKDEATTTADITIEKYVSIDGGKTWLDAKPAPGPSVLVGTTLQFKFIITNSGGTKLYKISLEDNFFDLSSLTPTLLEELESGKSFEGILEGIPAVSGQHKNTAYVSAAEWVYSPSDWVYSPSCWVYDSDDAYYFGTHYRPFIPTPSITVKKYVSVDGGTNWLDAETAPGPSVAEGSTLRFKFVVTNTGNVSLSDPTLTDSDFTLSDALKPTFLNPGASFEYILTGITAAAGQHQNTAYASGVYGGLVYSDFDHAHYWGSKKDAPSISIKKYVSVDKGLSWLDANTGPGPTADVGKEVRYKFVIVNSGNVPLTGLSLTDSKHTLLSLTLPASLAAGATFEYSLSGVEATKGEHLNTATVSGVYNRVSYSDSDKAYYTGKEPVVPEPAKPAVTVKKYVSVNEGSTWLDADTAPGTSVLVDSNVWFKFIMTNSGNVTLTDLTLTDSEYNLGNVGLPAKLDPGHSFEYIFKGVKAKEGEQINIAVALAKYGNETVTDTDRAIYTGYRKDKPTPPTTGGYLSLSAILGMLLISGGIFLKKKSKAPTH